MIVIACNCYIYIIIIIHRYWYPLSYSLLKDILSRLESLKELRIFWLDLELYLNIYIYIILYSNSFEPNELVGIADLIPKNIQLTLDLSKYYIIFIINNIITI